VNIHSILHSIIHMGIHREKILDLIKRSRVVTSSEVAKYLKVSWNTADSYLKELIIEGKLERIKKEGVTLWMKK
jgi:Mn-dependent DtxR family transcriptional regulator